MQLSDTDQAFVRAEMAKREKAAGPTSRANELTQLNGKVLSREIPHAKSPEIVETLSGSESTVAERNAATAGGWRLIDGQRIQGEFVGFDIKPLVIKRALSEVYVGGVLFSQLDPVYRNILPMTIAHLENAKIEDVRDIEKWLIKSGPGPWSYNIEAVMIETANGGKVSIPTFLLNRTAAESIALPLRRWREALASDVSEDDRNNYFDRERFMTRASMAAQLADERVEQQARYMRLELLAVASGATDLWNVSLLPRIGYGYPYHVLVPGQNSHEAGVAALQRYPNYTIGGVAKHNTF